MLSSRASIIHSFQKYSLDAYYVLITVPGAGDPAVTRKTVKNFALLEPSFYETNNCTLQQT